MLHGHCSVPKTFLYKNIMALAYTFRCCFVIICLKQLHLINCNLVLKSKLSHSRKIIVLLPACNSKA